MKRYLWKAVIVVLVMVGLVGLAQPALAWVRVGINVRIPFPVVVAPVAAVFASPVVYARPAPVYYQPAVYQPVWTPGHFNRWGARVPGHYNRWGEWVPGHWR